MNKEDILKKFSDKDSKFDASKVLDCYNLSKKADCQSVSDFLTPVFLTSILEVFEKELGIYDINTWGGFESAERRCIIFNKNDYGYFDIDVLKLSINTKFNKALEHRAVLGSILGLGITRNKIGDIIFENDDCYVFVKSDISNYIQFNLEYVGRTKVKVEVSEYTPVGDSICSELKTTTVSSLRVDTIISNITNYSRSEVKKLFEKELILVNWRVCNNTSYTVKEGDTITIRKYGRIKLENIKGFSKKGKYIIEYL